ncbi:MAG: hypothetical protein ACFWTY_01095 [Shouchella clausii]|jgi:hypothetical protein
MIEVNPVNKDYLICLSCGAKNPLHISVGDENHVRSIRLCLSCVHELKDKADKATTVKDKCSYCEEPSDKLKHPHIMGNIVVKICPTCWEVDRNTHFEISGEDIGDF